MGDKYRVSTRFKNADDFSLFAVFGYKFIGNKAVNSELGVVELTKSGAKSTSFHRDIKRRAGAVLAVKDVIEKGEIVSSEKNWKGRGYDTYMIVGHGDVDGKDSIVGVIVKSYPKEAANKKFHLHDVIEIGAETDATTENGVKTSVNNESAPISNSISHSSEDVNRLIREGEATSYISDVTGMDAEAINKAKMQAFAKSIGKTAMSDFDKANAIQRYTLKEQALEQISSEKGVSDETEKTSEVAVAKSGRKSYNEYNTNGMQWAYDYSTKVGDRRILFNPRTQKYALIEAIKEGVGFIELSVGTLEEMERDIASYEKHRQGEYSDDKRLIDSEIHNFKTRQNNDTWNNVDVGHRAERVRNAEVSEGKLDSNRTADSSKTDGTVSFLKASTAETKGSQENAAKENTTTEGGVEFCDRSNYANEFNPDGLTLKEQLAEAYDSAKPKDRRYVYVGKFTQSFVEKLKNHVNIKDFPIVMNYRDAYLSMHSKENGKYKGEGINYHNLGIEGLESALKSFDSPEYVLMSKKEGKIELILEGRDYKNRQLFSIVEVNTKTQNDGKFISVHVVNSVYGNRGLQNRIALAEKEGRKIYDKKEESTQGISQVQYKRDINVNSSKNSIHNPDENVNTKFSDRDNTGRKLSEGQQEYFKDSMVRDENGNLKVMYRGDTNEFTVFDRKKSKYSNLYGRGFYFTESKEHASQYGNTREFYLNITNPLTTGQNNITKKQMLDFLKEIENDGEDYDLYNYGENATAESVLKQVWGKGDFEMLQDVSASAVGDLVAAIELFNKVNGTTYDGIILPTETITFESEQAKLTSNKTPTYDADVRFSMRENVEETKDLIAVHNLNSYKLNEAIKLGGFPGISVAITKADMGHTGYGDISVVLRKETVDPAVDDRVKLYSGDAWTPTTPETVSYLDKSKVRQLKKEVDEFAKKHGLTGKFENEFSRKYSEVEGREPNDYIRDPFLMAMYLDSVGKLDEIDKDLPQVELRGAFWRAVNNDPQYNDWERKKLESITKGKRLVETVTKKGLFGIEREKEVYRDYTAENIVKSMMGQENGVNLYNAGVNEFSSIDDAKSRSDMLEFDEDADKKYDALHYAFQDFSRKLPSEDDAKSRENRIKIVRIIKSNNDTATAKAEFKKQFADVYTEALGKEFEKIDKEARGLRRKYFEAKLYKVTSFDELAAIVVPDNIDADLKAKLGEMNVNVVEYEHGNNEARLNVLNSVEGVRFSRRGVDNRSVGEYILNKDSSEEVLYDEETETGRRSLAGRRGRSDIQNPREQSGGIFGRAGTLTERSREDRQATARLLRTKLLTKKTLVGKTELELIDRKSYTDDMLEIVAYNKKQGVKTFFFVGQGTRADKPLLRCNGMHRSNREVYLSYDCRGSLLALNRHELVHHFFDTEVMQKNSQIFQHMVGSEKLNEIYRIPAYQRYLNLYEGDTSKVFEEVVADTFSGINKGETHQKASDLVSALWNGTFDEIDAKFNELGLELTEKPQKNPKHINYSLADDGMWDFDDVWRELVEEYGAIPKGENPVRDVDVPRQIDETRVVSRFARTMMEAGVTPDFAMSEFEKRILDGTMTHEAVTSYAVRYPVFTILL